MFWILREPLDVYERPFGVWRFVLLALTFFGVESLVKRKANPPIKKMETSVNVARSNQTNTNDTTKITNPITVVFQLEKIRSSIGFVFQIIPAPSPNRVSQRRDHRDQSDDLGNLRDQNGRGCHGPRRDDVLCGFVFHWLDDSSGCSVVGFVCCSYAAA
jgi:hypothetical protein